MLHLFISLSFVSTNILAKDNKFPLGMNLAGIHDWSTAFPFLNLTRQSRAWIAQMDGRPWGKGGELELDQNGWVMSLKPGQTADLIFISRNGPLPDNKFVVWYDGEGEIVYSGIVKKERSLDIRKDLLTVKREKRGKYAILTIKKTNKNNYIRNIHIVPLKYYELYSRGQRFNPDWLSYIKHFRAIRFMNWMKTNGSGIRFWSERPKVNDYTWSIKGVPIEIIVELANQIKSDIWLNIPHMANEEYVRKLSKYVTTHLRRSLKVYLEHSNEVWNWRFPQAHYASKRAEKRWGKHNLGYVQWHAMRTVNACSWWRTSQSNNNPLICVLGLQAGSPRVASIVLECPLWENGPCHKKGIDAIAIAAYFTGCLDGVAGWNKPNMSQFVRTWFSDKDGGMYKAYEQTLNGKYFDCARSLNAMYKKYQLFKNTAKKYGVSLLAYEGGQHITGNGRKMIQDDKDFINFHLRFNRTDYMRRLTLENFEKWKSAGGDLFMYFDDFGSPSKWGSFGSMDYLGDFHSPKYKAIIEFSKKYMYE